MIAAIRTWLAARGDVIDGAAHDALPPTPNPLRDDTSAADRVAGGRIALVIVAMVAIIVGTGVGVLAVAPRGGESAVTSPAFEVSPADPLSLPTAHEVRRAAQRASRDHWEWSDRVHRRVREPLARAIDDYLREEHR
jgi:hypothetical protein